MKIADLDWLAYELYCDAVNEIPVNYVIYDYFVGKLEEFIEFHKINSTNLSTYYNKAKIKEKEIDQIEFIMIILITIVSIIQICQHQNLHHL